MNFSSPSQSQVKAMADLQDRELSRDFSGKLPFRTQPETHKSIFLASKKAGRSINAWMEEVLREAAAKQNTKDRDSDAPIPKSQSIQTLFQENPDLVFELIDQIKPELKSHKTKDTIVLMGEIEKLMTNYELVRSEVKKDLKPDTVALIESILAYTETSNTTEGVMDCVTAIEKTISPWLQKPDPEREFRCTKAIGEVFVSVAEIRSCLKDSSLENTLSIIKPVIHTFSSQ